MRLIFSTLLFACAIAGLPAQAETLTSSYSAISRKTCPNDFNRPLAQLAEHQAITYRCKGPAGSVVAVRYGGAFVDVTISGGGLSWAGKPLRAGYDVGERIEWRGVQSVKGFELRAGILRLRRREESGKFGDVLAILARNGNRLCAAAFLDASASPNGNELARQTADGVAGVFRCGTDAPGGLGQQTERLADVMDENR
jgi:hypothetical protein